MSNKYIAFILVLCLIIMLMIKIYIRHADQIITILMILFFSIFVAILNIPIQIKMVLGLIVLSIYWVNIKFWTELMYIIWSHRIIYPGYMRNNDFELSQDMRALLEHTQLFKHNFEHLPDKPSIIVCNYSSDLMEKIFCIAIPKKIAVIMKTHSCVHMFNNAIFGPIIHCPIYINTRDGSYNYIKSEIQKHINNKRYILCYVSIADGDNKIYKKRIRSGMFKIAKELNIPVTPVAIGYFDLDFISRMTNKTYEIKVGNTFNITDIDTCVQNINKFFRKNLGSEYARIL